MHAHADHRRESYLDGTKQVNETGGIDGPERDCGRNIAISPTTISSVLKVRIANTEVGLLVRAVSIVNS